MPVNRLPATPQRMERVVLARDLLTQYLAANGNASHYLYVADQLGLDWLLEQGLAALMWHGWFGRGIPAIPEEFTLCLRTAYYAAVGDAELHHQEIKQILQALAESHVIPVAFKGAALAYTVYPDAVCRPMSDVDLWLQPDDMLQAASVLAEQSYVPRFKATRPVAMARQNGGELQLVGQSPGTGLIELHWGVFPGEWLQRTANVDDDGLWARTMPATLAGQPALILAPEDNVLQVAVHIAINHNMSSPWLRGLMDIALLARHYPIDWDVIVQRARAWRVATALWLVLSLTVDLAGLEEAAETVRQLQPSSLRRRLIHRFANAQTLVEMRDLSSSRWRYVFLLLLVDRPRDAVKLAFRALWPEREWLMARYGHYTFSTRVRHLLDAARGKI
jgi:hypothetical protein